MEASYLIETREIVKRYSMGRHFINALDRVSIHFQKGEFAALVGPSGSGKTTLLNILGSLDTPTEGNVFVMGKQIETLSHRESAELRSQSIGFIFQTFNLLPVYTVYENVELPLLLLHEPQPVRKKKILDALEWVGLADRAKSRPGQLSGGECQRVAIARAVVKNPGIVLADEPTANLDAANSHHILKTMEEINLRLNTTFLFATHDEKVIQHVRRKITLVDGRISQDEILSRAPSSPPAKKEKERRKP